MDAVASATWRPVRMTYRSQATGLAKLVNVNGTFTVEAEWPGMDRDEAARMMDVAKVVVLRLSWSDTPEFQERVRRAYEHIGFKNVVVNLHFE